MDKQSGKYPVTIISMMLTGLILITGCQTQAKRDPAFAAVRPPLPPVEPESNGSIYKPGFDVRLFEDLKARRVGDILTVTLVETTDASKSVSTKIDKDTTTTIANPTIFGTTPQFDVPNFLPLSKTKDLNLSSNINSDNAFDSSGSSTQKNA